MQIGRIVGLFTAALALGGGAVLLWPLHSDAVTGNALIPHYRDFGWVTYEPVPAHPTSSDLRRAGVPMPQDQVTFRRRLGAVLVGAGLAGNVGAAILSRRGYRRRPA